MGVSQPFFNNKEIDIRTKLNIYTSFIINAILWGCEIWNLSSKNKKTT